MILLLGASGYIGQAFALELRRRGRTYVPLTREGMDYSRFELLFDYVRTIRPAFVINASGIPASASVVRLPGDRERIMAANCALPETVARVCTLTKTPWGHVSSGEIYSGGKIQGRDGLRVAAELSAPDCQAIFENEPGRLRGFLESDTPNLSHFDRAAGIYNASKSLAEHAIRGAEKVYVWRPTHVFDETAQPGNYLARLLRCQRVEDCPESVSHREDFVRAALDLWDSGAEFGTYNMANPGVVSTRQIVERLRNALGDGADYFGAPSENDAGAAAARLPESHRILDATKLLQAGVRIRPAEEAMKEAIDRIRAAVRAGRVRGGIPAGAPVAA